MRLRRITSKVLTALSLVGTSVSLTSCSQLLANLQQNQAAALINQANVLTFQHNYAEALPLCQQACEAQPTNANNHLAYGLCLYETGSLDVAEKELNLAIKLNKNMADAYQYLYETKEAQGDLKSAWNIRQHYLTLLGGLHEPGEKDRTTGLKSDMNDRRFEGNDFLPETSLTRWRRQDLKVFIARSDLPDVKPSYEQKIKQAFTQWSEASNNVLKFRYVDSEHNADITVKWSDKTPPIALEAGNCLVDYKGGTIEKAHITLFTLNPTSKWKILGREVQQLSLHEIGHALGLIKHSPRPGDVMYRIMLPPLIKNRLSDRDQSTLRKLYGI